MNNFVDILRSYPAIAIFLTVGLGFLIGRIKIKSFSLGSVTSVLLVGVLIGQLDIPMSGPIKTFFFMMFLFSIGYSVGPQFFRSLKGMGLKQALFAVIMGISIFGVTLGMAKIMGYTKGETVGLFSGSQTCSALIGLGSESIKNLHLDDAVTAKELNIIPVCYAVTYIFGTLGTVILLGNLGPWLLGGLDKVKRDTLELEKSIDRGITGNDPAYVEAMRKVSFRSYIADNPIFSEGITVKQFEKGMRSRGYVIYVDRIRKNGEITEPEMDTVMNIGDVIVICGRREYMVNMEDFIGPETDDEKLLSYNVQCLPITISARGGHGKTIADVRRRTMMHGVMILGIEREGREIEVKDNVKLVKGDIVTVIGRDIDVAQATRSVGYVDRPSTASDLMFVGLSIFIGGLFGALVLYIDNIPISFGTSGGALVAGLVFGWFRSKRPTFGYIPDSAVWLMNNLGLNVFIAVIGIESGPSFISGLQEVGPMLFVAGIVTTTLPLLFGLFLGHKVFKFHPAITLGCCAGTRTCTASLGAVQNALGSSLPAMGYTVTYAVSNILLVIWGLVTVILV